MGQRILQVLLQAQRKVFGNTVLVVSRRYFQQTCEEKKTIPRKFIIS